MTQKLSEVLNIDAKAELKLLAQNIKVARKRRKITLAEMAKRTAVSSSTLSRLEAADPTVSIATVLQVLSVLGLVRGLASLTSADNDVEQVLSEVRELRLKKRPSIKKSFSKDELDF